MKTPRGSVVYFKEGQLSGRIGFTEYHNFPLTTQWLFCVNSYRY